MTYKVNKVINSEIPSSIKLNSFRRSVNMIKLRSLYIFVIGTYRDKVMEKYTIITT